jgi:hypothetical protein
MQPNRKAERAGENKLRIIDGIETEFTTYE